MKITKSVILSLILLIIVSATYRIFPDRPYGFAPQFAMAIFGGAIFIKNKKWAFLLPIVSMFLSDLLYQGLFSAGMSSTQGFYSGQWVNYLLFAGLTLIGFCIKKINIQNVLAASIASPTVYFIASNFLVWTGGGGLNRPRTWDGLMMCYADALPFYPTSIISTILFSTVLFGGYYFLKNFWLDKARLA